MNQKNVLVHHKDVQQIFYPFNFFSWLKWDKKLEVLGLFEAEHIAGKKLVDGTTFDMVKWQRKWRQDKNHRVRIRRFGALSALSSSAEELEIHAIFHNLSAGRPLNVCSETNPQDNLPWRFDFKRVVTASVTYGVSLPTKIHPTKTSDLFGETNDKIKKCFTLIK